MKAAVLAFVLFLTLVIPASAANSSPASEVNTAHITQVYSDLESFDVAIFSDKPSENLDLQVTLLRPSGNREEVLARQVLPVGSLQANEKIIKVGYWNIKNAERGAYSTRASLIMDGLVLSESKYDFTYGDNSVFKLRVGNLVTNSEGVSVILSPVEPVLFDLEYMLVDGSNVIYDTKKENLSLTSFPQTFSVAWGTLLEDNKEYQGRIKIKVNSSEVETIASTKPFIAKANAEITDIYKDETGASATVYGRSQVPFEGSLAFNVYRLNDTGKNISEPLESIREKVPVLLDGDDETVEVAWKERLEKGIYRLEIELEGNSGEVIEHRETVIESNLSPYSNQSPSNNSTQGTAASSGKNIPGFSAPFLISGLAAISFILRRKV